MVFPNSENTYYMLENDDLNASYRDMYVCHCDDKGIYIPVQVDGQNQYALIPKDVFTQMALIIFGNRLFK